MHEGGAVGFCLLPAGKKLLSVSSLVLPGSEVQENLLDAVPPVPGCQRCSRAIVSERLRGWRDLRYLSAGKPAGSPLGGLAPGARGPVAARFPIAKQLKHPKNEAGREAVYSFRFFFLPDSKCLLLSLQIRTFFPLGTVPNVTHPFLLLLVVVATLVVL